MVSNTRSGNRFSSLLYCLRNRFMIVKDFLLTALKQRKFNCEFNIHFHDTIFQQKHLYPININGNISFEGISKHSKFRRCDSCILCVVFLFTVNVKRTLPVNRFHSKSFYVLHDKHLSSNVVVMIFF